MDLYVVIIYRSIFLLISVQLRTDSWTCCVDVTSRTSWRRARWWSARWPTAALSMSPARDQLLGASLQQRAAAVACFPPDDDTLHTQAAAQPHACILPKKQDLVENWFYRFVHIGCVALRCVAVQRDAVRHVASPQHAAVYRNMRCTLTHLQDTTQRKTMHGAATQRAATHRKATHRNAVHHIRTDL